VKDSSAAKAVKEITIMVAIVMTSRLVSIVFFIFTVLIGVVVWK